MNTDDSNKKSLFRKGLFELFAATPLRLAIIAAGLASTFLLTTSLAVFTDTETSPSNHFETGTLSLGLNPITAIFNATGMKPGDVVYAPLTLTNTGTNSLNFTMATTATNTDNKGLAAALVGEVRKVATSSCTASTFSASSTTMASNVTGLASLATSSAITLASGASYIACFQVTLPSSAGNSVQGASTNASFTFSSVIS